MKNDLTAGRVARRLLAFYDNKPERWTQGWFAKTASGAAIGPAEPNAVCFCALGALQKILDLHESAPRYRFDRYREAREVLCSALGRSPGAFNDMCPSFETFKTRLHEIARTP